MPPDTAARCARHHITALSEHLTADRDAFDLVPTATRVAGELVDTLELLGQDGAEALGPLTAPTPEQRREQFIAHLVDRVAGPGGLVADAAARRAVTRCAETLLERHPPLRQAVDDGSTSGHEIWDGLLCEIYRMFFADTVTQFLTAVIAGKITAAVPALPLLDPTGALAHNIASHIADAVPTPCEEREANGIDKTVADIGRDIAGEALTRALGLPVPDP